LTHSAINSHSSAILGAGLAGEKVFHGLFSTVCTNSGTNPRKQAQSSFTEITYENAVFTNDCKTAQNHFR